MNRFAASLAVAALVSAAGVAHAQTWAEQGPNFGSPPHPDADRLPGTANLTAGVGPLTQITGWNLNGGDHDMYCITITDAANFSASAIPSVGTRNLGLALFDANGVGVAANWDRSATDNTPLLNNIPGLTNGTYFLLLTGTVSYAQDFTASFIFNPPAASSGQTGLQMPNSPFAISGYGFDFGAGFGGSNVQNSYVIDLVGAGYHMVPTPGAASLLGVAALVAGRRKR